MNKAVYVVFCMDTEGPCADPGNLELLDSWARVDVAMDKLFAPAFRSAVLDSRNGEFKIGWFFLTWTGFRTNPRGRDFGYHKVRDHYTQRWGHRIAETGDEECWHYHQPSESGIGNEWGLDWNVSREYEQVISRQILDRNWFPSCFRAGGTILTPQASRWIDAWFPLDYTNRAPHHVPGIVDWTTGVAEWRAYHPDPEDFRRPGPGRRRMLRCLDLATNVSVLSAEEIEKAFADADAGRPAVLAVFDHDYRDIADRLLEFRQRVASCASRYPDVRWEYAGPMTAVRQQLGIPAQPAPTLNIIGGAPEVSIWTNGPVFQSIPWIAVRTAEGSVEHVVDGIVSTGTGRWTWSPPEGLEWSEAAFGVSTTDGQSATARMFRDGCTPDGILERSASSHSVHPHSIWEHSKTFHRSCRDRASGSAVTTDSVQQTIEILSSLVTPGMTVLDVGCAAGHAFHALIGLGLEYHGIDSYADGIEVGRHFLSRQGLQASRLRAIGVEDLPASERHDVVLCLNTLNYAPQFHLPLEIMARAATKCLIIRASFADVTRVRYLPDVLLEQGFHTMRAYFNLFGRDEIARFLESEGFDVDWVQDQRQSRRFGGQPEVVGGVALPAQFLVAKRTRPIPSDEEILGPEFLSAADRWHSSRQGGPNP